MSLLRPDNLPFLEPIYQTVSFSLPTVEAWAEFLAGKRDAWAYASDRNPTVAELESRLAALQGQDAAIVTSTGKSAIAAALLATLRAGDHVILLREGYKSTRIFAEGILTNFGVTTTLLGVDELPQLDVLLKARPAKIIVLESPTNPMTRVVDVAAVAQVARRHGCEVFLDNSLAGFHNHHGLPVDLYLHSLSKYGTGVGDVMGGAIIGPAKRIADIRHKLCYSCDTIAPSVAHVMLNGLHTYELRLERQCSTALAVAEFLENHPCVSRVLYPGLKSHPDYAIASRQLRDFSPVIAFDVVGDEATMKRMLNELRHFALAFGTAYSKSIAAPTWLFYARSFPEPQIGASAILPTTVRLSIGLEAADVLIQDLDQALRSTAADGAEAREQLTL